MACISPAGELTTQGRAVLAALRAPSKIEDVAERTGIALYRVRSSIRELVEAKLASESNTLFQISPSGLEKLAG
jgi:predicted transcriptional regulator